MYIIDCRAPAQYHKQSAGRSAKAANMRHDMNDEFHGVFVILRGTLIRRVEFSPRAQWGS